MILLVGSIGSFFGGFGYWSPGYGHVPLGSLASSLKEANYPVPFGGGYLSRAEGYGIVGRFVIGGGGFTLKFFKSTSPDYNSSAEARANYLSVGYVAFAKGDIFVFPSVGLGGGSVGVKVQEAKAGNFNDILRDPPIYIHAVGEGLFLKGDITLLYRYGLLLVGLTAGMGYVKPYNWTVNGNATTGYPTDDYPVFYLSLNFGGGWIGFGGGDEDVGDDWSDEEE
ncbi:MAG: hypothetical protein GXO29_03115 [Thermotogae bacterium]|nr:hypothetical protein [Thermotogota bacterium]